MGEVLLLQEEKTSTTRWHSCASVENSPLLLLLLDFFWFFIFLNVDVVCPSFQFGFHRLVRTDENKMKENVWIYFSNFFPPKKIFFIRSSWIILFYWVERAERLLPFRISHRLTTTSSMSHQKSWEIKGPRKSIFLICYLLFSFASFSALFIYDDVPGRCL